MHTITESISQYFLVPKCSVYFMGINFRRKIVRKVFLHNFRGIVAFMHAILSY